MSYAKRLWTATSQLAARCDDMTFKAPVTHVYNPLRYAKETHRMYLRKYGDSPKRVLFLGMNPGPWGMAQTGVPFGEVNAVRDWMNICGKVGAPANFHPSRPVLGFECKRSEVSGRRLWGMFSNHAADAAEFFDSRFVINYCPLLFLQSDERRCVNITPDKLSAAERETLFAACDDFLRKAVEILTPESLIGIGNFAEERLRLLFEGNGAVIGKIPHPSPANPSANKNYAAVTGLKLQEMGVWG